MGHLSLSQRIEVITENRLGTDPYARWCGGRELATPGYPIWVAGLSCGNFIVLPITSHKQPSAVVIVCH